MNRIESALSRLDDIANSDACMGCDDIERLGDARGFLASELGYVYNDDTNRYEKAETS